MLTPTRPALAWEVAAGAAAIEEGDDRMRPGASLHLGVDGDYGAHVYYWGREFGPVKETSYLLGIVKRVPVIGSKLFHAKFGLAALNERTAFAFDAADTAGLDSDRSQPENNYNLGAALGMAINLKIGSGPLFFSVAWDSHIFAAGLSGAIFLSSGRKQALTLLMGLSL